MVRNGGGTTLQGNVLSGGASIAAPARRNLSVQLPFPSMSPAEIDLTIYPDECDAYGHLNQASFLALFERARWEMLARGPGMDLFGRSHTWPAVRKATIDYHAPGFPGDVLRFRQTMVHRGRTSFTLRQTARRTRDDALIGAAEFVFVCIDAEGRPVEVPEAFTRFMGGDRVMVNGVHLAVEAEGHGPAVLLIHGYPLDRTIWRDSLAGLNGFRWITPDLRGMGRSDAPDLGYSIATYADDLAALLTALNEERAIVCGISMGGYIAFELIRRHRDRVRALILMDTRAEADSPEGKKARDNAVATAREGGAAAIAQEMIPRLLAPDAPTVRPQVVERMRKMIEATPVAGIVGALTAMRDRVDSTPLLPSLKDLPTLVVTGAQDALISPEAAQRMAEAIPGARLATIAGAGHLPPVEQPEATARVLADFLKGLA
jgi:3-oxoadipate enol-lactonase